MHEICPSFGILNSRKHNVSEKWIFPPSGEGRDTQTLLGLSERTSLTGLVGTQTADSSG
jgi:hypothetical protein